MPNPNDDSKNLLVDQWKVSNEHCWISWEEENGEEVPILNFSHEFMDKLGWRHGDEIDFQLTEEDGTIKLINLTMHPELGASHD